MCLRFFFDCFHFSFSLTRICFLILHISLYFKYLSYFSLLLNGFEFIKPNPNPIHLTTISNINITKNIISELSNNSCQKSFSPPSLLSSSAGLSNAKKTQFIKIDNNIKLSNHCANTIFLLTQVRNCVKLPKIRIFIDTSFIGNPNLNLTALVFISLSLSLSDCSYLLQYDGVLTFPGLTLCLPGFVLGPFALVLLLLLLLLLLFSDSSVLSAILPVGSFGDK